MRSPHDAHAALAGEADGVVIPRGDLAGAEERDAAGLPVEASATIEAEQIVPAGDGSDEVLTDQRDVDVRVSALLEVMPAMPRSPEMVPELITVPVRNQMPVNVPVTVAPGITATARSFRPPLPYPVGKPLPPGA